jgi:hypothetical protein
VESVFWSGSADVQDQQRDSDCHHSVTEGLDSGSTRQPDQVPWLDVFSRVIGGVIGLGAAAITLLTLAAVGLRRRDLTAG